MRALALSLFFAASLFGCIFVVSPEEYGATCRFEGEDTQCGSCIRQKCTQAIDECCRDQNCEQPLRDLDQCATQSSFACQTLKGATSPAAANTLAQCIQRECDAVCVEKKGTPTTSCREPRLGEGSACECSASGAPNDDVCSAAAFRDTLCCAPKGWPAPGLECTCQPLDCRPTDDGCFCRLADFTPKQRECSAVHCCVDKDVCHCGADECAGFETPVESCSVAVLRCAEGQEPVTSCSQRL